jgi:hypothetical protein
MEPSFSNIDELEATIYQTDPKDLDKLAQVNLNIYNLLHTKPVLNRLVEIHDVKDNPRSFEEFMAWIKCRHYSALKCIYNAIAKNYINLFLYIYSNMDTKTKRSIEPQTKMTIEDLIFIWILELGNRELLKATLDEYEHLSGEEVADQLSSVTTNLAKRDNHFDLLMRLLDFFGLDLIYVNLLKAYITGIVDNSVDPLLDLKNLKSYLDNKNIRVPFYDIVAEIAAYNDAIDILLWSIDEGANNYYQILVGLLTEHHDYNMIHQILAQHENNLDFDLIKSFLEALFEEMSRLHKSPFNNSNVALLLLLEYIEEKWSNIYNNLLRSYYYDEDSDNNYNNEEEHDEYDSEDDSDNDNY